MKKKGLFLKLGFLGIGLLSSSALVIGSLANVTSESVSTAKAEDSGDFYQISYANGELKLLLSANPSSYAHLNAQALLNAKNALFTTVSNALADQISILTSLSSDPTDSTVTELLSLEWTPTRYYAYTTTTGLDASLIEKIIAASLSTGGQADIDKVDAFNNDPTGSYSTTISYYADKYAEAHPEYNRNDVYADIAGVVSEKAQEMTTEAYQAAGYDAADIPTAATNIVDTLNDTKDTGVTIDLDDVTQMMSVIQDTMQEDSTITVSDFVNELGSATVSTEIKDVLADAEADQIQDFMTQVQPEVIADTITAVNLTGNEMKDVLDTVGLSKLLTIADQIDVEGIKTILQAVPDFTASDLKDFVKENVSSLSIGDILNALKDIKVDGNVVYANGQFNKSGIVNVLKSFPRPSTVANWTDDQMKLSWNVLVETSLGNMELDLTVGFFGDCRLIRTVCEYLDKAVDFAVEDGTIKIHVKAGTYLAKLVRKVINSNLIPEDIMKELFQFATSDVQGMYEMINTKLLSELIAELQTIDYSAALGTVLSADFLNETFHTNKLTDENIDRVIDASMKIFRLGNRFSFETFVKYVEKIKDIPDAQEDRLESLYNKFVNFCNRVDTLNLNSDMLRALIDETDDSVTNQNVYNAISKLASPKVSKVYDRVQNLITKLFDKLPDNWKNKKVMGTYEGNGVWAFAGEFNFDLHSVFASLSNSYGEDIYNALTSVMGSLPSSLKVDLSFEAKEMYSITYDYGNGETLVGALPSGVDITPFALQTTVNGYDIQKWVDADGNEVTLMPGEDTVVYAVTQFEITNSADVSKTFDNADSEISVDVYPAGNYTYQWFKDGVEVAGANAAALNVKNVADSGSYTCVVTREDGLQKESDPISVLINKFVIDVSDVDWDYTSAFTYDGTEKTVGIDPTTLPDHVVVESITGNTGTNAGSYTATVVLGVDDDNYELSGDTTLTLNWNISVADITVLDSDIAWNYTNAFTYDGATHTVTIDEQALPEHIVVESLTGNANSAAGTYTAVLVLGTDSDNYTINGQSTYEFNLTWTINKAEVDVSGVNFNADQFTYDGTEKTVSLNNFTGSDLVTIAYSGTQSATDAGQYSVSATITLIDAENYVLVGSATISQDWEIAKAVINVVGVEWAYESAYEYTGNMQVLTLNQATLPQHVVVAYEGNEATNVGLYLAKATLTPENANYELVGETVYTQNWKIIKAQIDVSDVDWNYTAAFTYDGTQHSVALDATTLPDHVVVKYKGISKSTNAGTYTVSATLSPENANYELVGNTTLSLTWTINKATIDVSGVKTNYTAPFTYNGEVQSIDILASTLPANVSYLATGNAALNAGSYVAVFTLSADSANYELVGNAVITQAWVINKGQIDVSGVQLNAADYTYTGSEYTVTVNESTLPANVQVTNITGNKGTNAGSYTAKITLACDSENYLLSATEVSRNWEIKKAQINMPIVEWDSPDSIDYDGKEHTVSVKTETVPVGVIVTYTGDRTATKVGSYSVTANFALALEFATNYELVGETSQTFAWEIVAIAQAYVSEEDENGNANGTVKSNMAVDGKLHVVLTDAKDLAKLNWNKVFVTGSGAVHAYYDVYFADANGNRIDLGSAYTFEISLLLPEEAAAKKANYIVVSVVGETIEKVESTREGNYMVFNSNLLGNFAIVEVGTASTPWWVLGLLVVAGAVIAVESYVIIVKAKKKK